MSDFKKEFTEDCPEYDEISTYLPATARTIVIGDVHGDEQLTYDAFELAHLIDKNKEWIAEPSDTIVVQVGDQIDRCRPFTYECDDPRATVDDEASDIKILEFFTEIDKKARTKGGRVISLLGNHEMMNAQGIMNYVSYKNRNELNDYKEKDLTFKSGLDARIHRFAPGNDLAKFMACTRLSILPELMKKYDLNKPIKTYEEINTLIRKWLLGHIKTTNVENLLNSIKLSPFWPRILGQIPPNIKMDDNEQCEKYVKPLIKTLQIGNIIVGHTPQFYEHQQGINSTCDSKVWRVDVGASKAFHPFDKINKKFNNVTESRKIQILEILNNKDKLTFNILKF
jgi:hypothetical protein